MKIGIVAYWFNGGQATVARHLRSALESLGHETHVLARPAPRQFVWPNLVRRDDVWAQERVTAGSTKKIPAREYIAWARDNALEVVFFDQNYQFDEIRALREGGVLTIGRFVWESFGADHVEGARAAFDVIYSVTACEQQRYRELGIDSPRVPWGCHPELVATPPVERATPMVRFFYPAGQLSRRKPTAAVVEAFRRVASRDVELVIKAQRPLGPEDVAAAEDAHDPRIVVVTDDLATADYHALFRSADVCLAPSRWEGLGLHLYEAVSFGMPLIVNDDPPANEVVIHGDNGLLVESHQVGTARSGIPAWEPDVRSLGDAIEALLDAERRRALAEGAARARERLPWSRTVEHLRLVLADAWRDKVAP